MANFYWIGYISDDLYDPANWSPAFPPGSDDTTVIIGSNPNYPDHPTYNWPSGGHLDMQIKKLYIAPAHNNGTGGQGIKIGTPTRSLTASYVKETVIGGFNHCSCWDDRPMRGAECWLRILSNTKLASTSVQFYGHSGDAGPQDPNVMFHMTGNPDIAYIYKSSGLHIKWHYNTKTLEGLDTVLTDNGPKAWGYDIGYPGIGGLSHGILDLDWQAAPQGGNPIQNMNINAWGSIINIAADNWAQGADGTQTCFVGTGCPEFDQQLAEDWGVVYYIKSTKPLGQDTAPIVIPSFNLLKSGLLPFDNVDKCYFQSGVTIGGNTPSVGLDTQLFDVHFTGHAATNTIIKSGTIRTRTTIDATEQAAGQFKMLNPDTGTGVLLDQAAPWGGGMTDTVKIYPPHQANIRVR